MASSCSQWHKRRYCKSAVRSSSSYATLPGPQCTSAGRRHRRSFSDSRLKTPHKCLAARQGTWSPPQHVFANSYRQAMSASLHWETHLQRHWQRTLQDSVSLDTATPGCDLQCDQCDYRAGSVATLKRHMIKLGSMWIAACVDLTACQSVRTAGTPSFRGRRCKSMSTVAVVELCYLRRLKGRSLLSPR